MRKGIGIAAAWTAGIAGALVLSGCAVAPAGSVVYTDGGYPAYPAYSTPYYVDPLVVAPPVYLGLYGNYGYSGYPGRYGYNGGRGYRGGWPGYWNRPGLYGRPGYGPGPGFVPRPGFGGRPGLRGERGGGFRR